MCVILAIPLKAASRLHPVTWSEKFFLVLSNNSGFYFCILRDNVQADTEHLPRLKKWKRTSNISWKKALIEFKGMTSYLVLWQHDIRNIEGISCLMSISPRESCFCYWQFYLCEHRFRCNYMCLRSYFLPYYC